MTGFRTWSTGDSVSAADFTSYIATQSVLIFADASARSSGVASPVNGMVSSLTTDNVISIYNGSAWVDVLDIDTLTVSGGNYTVTGTMTYGASGSGVDVTFHSATAGDHMMWDASEEKLILEGTHSATVLDVTDGNVVIGDGTLTVGSDGAGEDVTFYSDTSGDHMVWDSSAEKLTITGTDSQTALDVPDGNVTITDDLTVSGTTFTYLNVLTDSTTTRTPALTDASAYILTTHGTGITVTLPQNSAVAFPVGTTIYFERNGAGTLTFAAGTGATVTSKDSTLTCGDRYTTVAAIKISTNGWSLIGNIG